MQINNSLSTAVSHQWDFCLGDLDSLPAAAALPLIGGTLSYPLNMKMVEENGQYYGFIVNSFAGNYITRYNFGTSPANPPTAVNLNSDPLLGNVTSGIDMVKEGNKWYMFLTCYSSNALLRYEMDSITQLNPTLVNLNVPGLANPNSIKIIEGYGFITNNQSLEITRLDFGGSYANTPTILLPAINTGFFNNFGLDIDYDCEVNKYIGYTSCSSFGVISKLDFGNSLTNIPVVSSAITSLWTAQGLQLIREADKWHLFIVTDNNNYYQYTSGSSLDSPMVQQYTSNFGGIMSSPQNIQLTKVGSTWIGILPNKLLFSIVRLTFPQGCSGTVLYSADQSPASINFPPTDLGLKRFQLEETMTNGSKRYFLDSVLVNIPPPVAAFSSSPSCLNTPVQFIDNSTTCFGAVTGWNWDFGDGNTSTASSPAHTYTTASGFPVKLTVYNDNGDSASTQQNLVVHDLPQVWYSRNDSACAGSDVVFTDSSTSNDGTLQQWQWDFGDNSQSTGSVLTHAFTSPGIYQVQLIATTSFGCRDSVVRPIQINPGPFSAFSAFNTCTGETTQFINLTTASGTTVVSSDWTFGDGNSSSQTSPAHSYAALAGNYLAELVSVTANGCRDTVRENIRIANKPSPWFAISSDTVCTYAILQFTDSSFAGAGDTLSALYWDFGDGMLDSLNEDPTHFYTTPGNYTVSLRAKSPTDCDSTVTRNVFVIESPQAAFTTANECFGKVITFTDQSTSPAGSTLDTWQWQFGDSSGASTPNSQHNYLAPGNYQVSLIVRSDIGCYDTTTQQVSIYEIPVAAFVSGKACSDIPVHFTDSSFVNGSQITNWQWDFGAGGSVSTLQHPDYAFPGAFAYLVTLIATSAQGCADTVQKFVTVDQTPEFHITSTDACKGISASFSYLPEPGTSTNVSYLWNFGDTTASFLPNPAHLYAFEGQYIASLTVTDLNNSCFNTQSDTLSVFTLPRANFNFGNACKGSPIQFSDSSYVNNGLLTNWNWTFGSFGNSTLQNPSLAFNQTGNIPVRLLVITADGCKDSLTKSVQVNDLPQVSFQANPPYGAPPLPVQFTNNSDNGSYQWNFGDNTPVSAATSPLHQFNDTGFFHVNLITTDPNGCIDSAGTTIYVQIPNRDLAIKGASFIKVNNRWEMSAIVANMGNEDVSSFELKGILNGDGPFYNTFDSDTLKAGQTKTYYFNTKLEAQNFTPGYFCAEVFSVNNLNDMNPANDRFCISPLTTYEIINTYPNPFDNELYIGINMAVNGEIQISLHDLFGQTVIENQTYALNEGLNTLTIPVGMISSSVYLLSITYKESESHLRIVKR